MTLKPTDDIFIGPIKQLLTMDNLAPSGPLKDDDLEIIPDAGIRIKNGVIAELGRFEDMNPSGVKVHKLSVDMVALPGFIDAHTHICYAGSREEDYAKRLGGMSYGDIATQGGGILDTVSKTRQASHDELINQTLSRLEKARQLGVTTCEIKSGYGLSVEEEIKMLTVINEIARLQSVSVVPTCLAAHVKPREFASSMEYLQTIMQRLFPLLQQEKLSNRIDIFVDEGAFSIDDARIFLNQAKAAGFTILMHADQFSSGGAFLAAELQALSADHLEHSTIEEFQALKDNDVIPIVLPGSCLGLGLPFPNARGMLDSGLPLVIASDWNPGSAPMGNLLLQAAVLGAFECLSMAETLAAITIRAAKALQFNDRGILKLGMQADLSLFACSNYRQILYNQGSLYPTFVFCKGACDLIDC